MAEFRRTLLQGGRLTLVAVSALCVLESGVASAEVGVAAPPMQAVPRADIPREQAHAACRPIREAVEVFDYGRIAQRAKRPALQTSSSRKSSVGRKILGGAIGATAGFFAGGYLGAAIEGDCGGCDDPGLKGALIGAPVGAVTGGILGALVF